MFELRPGLDVTSHYDELYDSGGLPRAHYGPLSATLAELELGEILSRVGSINTTLLQRGVTFTVYAESAGTERIFPFDVIPRILTGVEWAHVERGVPQRVR